MKKIALVLFLLCSFFITNLAMAQDVHVQGYHRKDGTYVQPHYRSAPDGNVNNNWSTRGNVNPYTGQAGTRDPSPQFDSGSLFRNGDNSLFGSESLDGSGDSLYD